MRVKIEWCSIVSIADWCTTKPENFCKGIIQWFPLSLIQMPPEVQGMDVLVVNCNLSDNYYKQKIYVVSKVLYMGNFQYLKQKSETCKSNPPSQRSKKGSVRKYYMQSIVPVRYLVVCHVILHKLRKRERLMIDPIESLVRNPEKNEKLNCV